MSKNIIYEAAGLVWKLRFSKLFGTLKKRYLPG